MEKFLKHFVVVRRFLYPELYPSGNVECPEKLKTTSKVYFEYKFLKKKSHTVKTSETIRAQHIIPT